MNKLVVLFVFLFTLSSITGQEKALQLTHKRGNRVKILKENSRILIRTLDGEKYKGRFQITDEGEIIIQGHQIDLNSIRLIKRKPLAVKIVKGALLIPGTLLIGISIFAMNPLVVSVGISTGILANIIVLAIPEFFLTIRFNTKWSYEIINLLN